MNRLYPRKRQRDRIEHNIPLVYPANEEARLNCNRCIEVLDTL